MNSQVKTMAQKRARHYNESKTVLAVAMMLFGLCSALVLVVLWPQSFLVDIFDSRLTKRLVIDDHDFFTCSDDFVNFAVDEPTDEYSLFSFYIFSVTNAADVLQRGYKPQVSETGPFGFVRNTYKYDIYFDPVDSTSVTFKEYSYLTEVTDVDACEKMFFRMERDYLRTGYCDDGSCKCRNTTEKLVIVNPLFLKILWQDTSHELLGHYSAEVFADIKSIMDEPFTEAVKAHLVSFAFLEIYYFRTQMMVGTVLRTAFDYLSNKYGSGDYVLTNYLSETSCNLTQYSIPTCPFNPFGVIPASYNASYIQYPSLWPIFNASSNISVFNDEVGLPGWLGISWMIGGIDFNTNNVGYTMVTKAEMEVLYAKYWQTLCQEAFGTSAFTIQQQRGCEEIVYNYAWKLGKSWLDPFSIVKYYLQKLTYKEFQLSSDPVVCDPLGRKCVWQYGYMRKYEKSTYVLGDLVTYALIDLAGQISTNPNSLYKDVHAPSWYNVFLYRANVYYASADFQISCTDYANTILDATVVKPSALWGVETGFSLLNSTLLYRAYAKLSSTERDKYMFLAFNISYLLNNIYRTQSDFHDHYVINYINKYKDPLLTHNFTVGNWSELGIAQWGSGSITQAIAQVRAIKQIVRDGMWRIGAEKYYTNYLEYSSWCVKQGFPNAWLFSIDDSRTLLNELAREDVFGVLFRERVVKIGSTLIGDGVHYVNGVGDIGDIAFTREANRGNFSCSGESEAACKVMDTFFNSSAAQCEAVEALYTNCFNQYTYSNNKWVNNDVCDEFETSISSPSLGIQCSTTSVYGQTHPYLKSIGNVVAQMLYSLTLVTSLQEGLWCSSASNCDFTWGGMFATTSVKELLFEGYTEPSVLKYLNFKYRHFNVSFECVQDAYDHCGVQNFHCDSEKGVYMRMPNNQSFLFQRNTTDKDLFFSPSFFVDTTSGELFFPLANNSDIAAYAQAILMNASETVIAPLDAIEEFLATNTETANRLVVEVRNPYWTVFPAWTETDSSILKYFDCQKRIGFGAPNLLNSCETRVRTGSDHVENVMDLSLYYGNTSLASPFNSSYSSLVNGSTEHNQHNVFFWNGFDTFPYLYLNQQSGADYYALKYPSIFNKIFGVALTLSQDSLLFAFERAVSLTMPLPTVSVFSATGPAATPNSQKIQLRRFVEDKASWSRYQKLGTARDSMQMPYSVPIGFMSLQQFADFPLFVETPHSYGNELWGGLEYTFVSGTYQQDYIQRSFIDYDPVIGRSIRAATRQQLTVRMEASSIFPNAFSSQSRCIAPTKTYALSSGYGCFSYVPILWYEEARNIDNVEFFQFYDHYYTRPARGNVITIAGLVLGALMFIMGTCLLVSENHHRQRFKARIYVD